MKYFRLRPWMILIAMGSLSFGFRASLIAAGTAAVVDGPQKVGTLEVPSSVTVTEVRHVITNALIKRGWTIKSSDETTVTGCLKHRGYDAALIFHYDEKQIEIVSDSFRIDGAGKRLRRANPEDWIDNLESDIPRYLEGVRMSKE